MRPRILLNLAVFTALAAVMVSWALLTLLPLRFGAPALRVEAEFASSPGLRAGLEVDYLGVRVGSIEEVRLKPGKVAVTLLLETEPKLPAAVTAAVLRKSAVGEPYVELEPPVAAAAGPNLRDGDTIPLSRTEVTVEYQELFDSAGKMLRSVDPADLRVITRELSAGLDGRGQDLHDALADLDRLAGTVADDAGVLDALAVQLTALAGTLADEGPQLASGMNDLAAFTATLGTSLKEVDGILTRAPGFLEQVNGLLEDSRPGLRCVLTAMGTPGPPVFTPKNAKTLEHGLLNLRDVFPKMVKDVVITRSEGSYIRAVPLISLAGPVPNAEEYANSLPKTEIPPVYTCRTDQAASAKSPADPGSPSATPGATDEAARPAGTDPRQVFETSRPEAADPARGPSGFPARWLLLAAAGLILLGTAAHTVRQLYSTRRRS
ncbi:phospholipid/cholesterol/gamma-HCH transport system substrate-binding protein [Actinocorallia herbida]|uniref:Phospholipid/cholesterol/gamma-HCH transport system substrate-binding protein n=1 Tax=Actinocorallia herbida TaxID=58109 RepID=A0A3N1CXB8_9ACTN|nr:MCE family protein [Actinocorallia herbida]ROO85949.1 phospholipid/cholesterol/gamma-HCH transport system substrate-binding protein [Actinocorallia herbida]